MSVETVLHAFLSLDPPELRERCLEFLPSSRAEKLRALPPNENPPHLEDLKKEDLLDRVHWSWFLPTLKSYAPEEQALFLSALDPSSAAHLSNEIPCKISTKELSAMGSAYLRHILLSSLIGEHDRLIPRIFLPPSPLNQLLTLSKKELILLIDLLSMHDLAAELRQIVETKILKNIYSYLTEMERKFLKQVSLKPEPYALPRIGLDRWDGNREVLRITLHRRGLARLGVALSGEDPALVWYLCHQLDIGRGTALFKLCVRESSLTTIDAAAKQVEELLGYG